MIDTILSIFWFEVSLTNFVTEIWIFFNCGSSEGKSKGGECAEYHTWKQGDGRVASRCSCVDIAVGTTPWLFYSGSKANRIDNVRFFGLDCAVVTSAWCREECSWISLDRCSEPSKLCLAQALDLLWNYKVDKFCARRWGKRTFIVPELAKQVLLVRDQAEVDSCLVSWVNVISVIVCCKIASDEIIFHISTCLNIEENRQITKGTICTGWQYEAVISRQSKMQFEIVVIAVDSVLRRAMEVRNAQNTVLLYRSSLIDYGINRSWCYLN